jgi:hypothetical protein
VGVYFYLYSFDDNSASDFLMISITTETTIRRAVPPIAKDWFPEIAFATRGRTAMTPKNNDPTRVIRVTTCAK